MDEITIMCDGVQVSTEEGRVKLSILGVDEQDLYNAIAKIEEEKYRDTYGFNDMTGVKIHD